MHVQTVQTSRQRLEEVVAEVLQTKCYSDELVDGATNQFFEVVEVAEFFLQGLYAVVIEFEDAEVVESEETGGSELEVVVAEIDALETEAGA